MARISRLLTVVAVTTFAATGFADDWRPTTAGSPYGPALGNPYTSTVGNPYGPTFSSSYYGPAPAVQPGQTPPPPGIEQPPVVGAPYGSDDCCGQDGPHYPGQDWSPWYDQDHSFRPMWGASGHRDYWGEDGFHEVGRWYASADALWLKRNKPNNKTLALYNPNGRVALDTDDLSFDIEPGARITFGRYIGPTTSIEGSFFGFNDWNSSERTTLFDDGPLNAYWIGTGSGNGLTDAFVEADRQTVNYSSKISNWELGVRKSVGSDASLLFGLRYFAYDEDLTFRSFKESGGLTQRGIYDIGAQNDMIGLQIGGQHSYRPDTHKQWISLTVFGKAGMFVNFHEQYNRLASTNADGSRWSSSRDNDSTRLSSVLEFGAFLTLRLGDYVSLRGGYNHMFFDRLALAPDQIDTAPDGANSRLFVNDNGSLRLYGPFIGGEIILP